MNKQRWTPLRAAVVTALLVVVALFALGLFEGARTGEYDATGETIGRILIPAMIVVALVASVVQKGRIAKDRDPPPPTASVVSRSSRDVDKR